MKQEQLKVFTRKLDNLFKPKLINLTMYAMLFSYFYNLPIINYSVKGTNELRIYDICGLIVLYYYFANYNLIKTYLSLHLNLKRLNQFLLWANITLIGTLAFSFYFNRLIWFVQTILYLYHFWIFFLTAVFISIMVRDRSKFKLMVF